MSRHGVDRATPYIYCGKFSHERESVAATLQNFRNRFQLSRHDPVSDRKTILLWVKNFRATGSALKWKPPGRPRSVWTPENIQIVKESYLDFKTFQKNLINCGTSYSSLSL